MKKPPTKPARVKRIPIDQLLADPANARIHTPRNQDALARSFKRFGAGRSIVVDGENVVRAGNGALEAAKAAGVREVIVVESDGKELVVVKRPDWTPEQAAAYALADNRIAETAEWNVETLADQLRALADTDIPIEDIGFNEKEVTKLLSRLDTSTPPETGSTDPRLAGLEYRVIVDCASEEHQRELLKRFESEGLRCRPLIS